MASATPNAAATDVNLLKSDKIRKPENANASTSAKKQDPALNSAMAIDLVCRPTA